ncbi:MAG: peptidoglycan-binding protein [Chitinophagales bacterium]
MAIQLNDQSPLVKKWQQFLQKQGFLSKTITATNLFGAKTQEATIAFQKYYGIKPAAGVAGSVTLGKAYELGFNPDKEPTVERIATDRDLMQWISTNLGDIITKAVSGGASPFPVDLLAGMVARETGFLITRYVNQGHDVAFIHANMKGDYHHNSYHGYGYWQIDIGSYPDFINSGNWADPNLCCAKAIAVLKEKAASLKAAGWQTKLSASEFERACVAAYNCGQGNVLKALAKSIDVDSYTFNKDYSKEVLRYRSVFNNL